jgi:hypothetical protein
MFVVQNKLCRIDPYATRVQPDFAASADQRGNAGCPAPYALRQIPFAERFLFWPHFRYVGLIVEGRWLFEPSPVLPIGTDERDGVAGRAIRII